MAKFAIGWRRWLGAGALVVLGAAAACDSGSGGGDGSTGERPTCAQLAQQIAEAVGVPGSCRTDDDCTYVGGQLSGTQTCDCAPYVLDCGGRAIERNAPGLSRAEALIKQLVAEACPVDSACDCGINGPLRCGSDHRCSAALRSCLPPAPPPDDTGAGALP